MIRKLQLVDMTAADGEDRLGFANLYLLHCINVVEIDRPLANARIFCVLFIARKDGSTTCTSCAAIHSAKQPTVFLLQYGCI